MSFNSTDFIVMREDAHGSKTSHYYENHADPSYTTHSTGHTTWRCVWTTIRPEFREDILSTEHAREL